MAASATAPTNAFELDNPRAPLDAAPDIVMVEPAAEEVEVEFEASSCAFTSVGYV